MSSFSHPNRAFGRPLAALRRIPRPILTVLLVFALGLGVNTAIFTFGYLKFLTPYPHADELVVLRPEMQGHEKGVLAADFISWKQQATVFQDLEASTEGAFSINVRGGSEKVTASLVTAGFYRMMGDRFYLGRDFTSEDGTPGKQRFVILAHALWKRLGANPAMIGTIILMDGEPYTVAGGTCSRYAGPWRAGDCAAHPWVRRNQSGCPVVERDRTPQTGREYPRGASECR
jgi:putative ABC transport system permease protein